MRKYILICFFFFLFFRSLATIIGGEIVSKYIGENNYVITLSTFDENKVIPSSEIVNLFVNDETGNFLFSFQPKYNSELSEIIYSGKFSDINKCVYIDTIALRQNQKYNIIFNGGVRRSNIINLNSYKTHNLILALEISHDSLANSSPVYITSPIFYAKLNEVWSFNPLPYDADGDSISWYLDTPLSDNMLPLSEYEIPKSDSSHVLKMDKSTASMYWMPNKTGTYIICIVVEEFKNGIKKSKIRREIELRVVNDFRLSGYISENQSLIFNNKNFAFAKLPVNELFQVNLSAVNPLVNEKVHIESYGEPYLIKENASTFSTTSMMKKPNLMTGNFVWKPANNDARKNPYFVVFRVKYQDFAKDYTFKINAEKPSDIIESKAFSIGNIYPNPVISSINLTVTLDKDTKISLRILDLLGNQVWNTQSIYPAGKHLISTSINFPNGQYIAQILKNGTVYKTQKILVLK